MSFLKRAYSFLSCRVLVGKSNNTRTHMIRYWLKRCVLIGSDMVCQRVGYEIFREIPLKHLYKDAVVCDTAVISGR